MNWSMLNYRVKKIKCPRFSVKCSSGPQQGPDESVSSMKIEYKETSGLDKIQVLKSEKSSNVIPSEAILNNVNPNVVFLLLFHVFFN